MNDAVNSAGSARPESRGTAIFREVWVIALEEQRVHVYRRPGAQAYAEHGVFQCGDSLEIAAVPDAGAFSVDAMLG